MNEPERFLTGLLPNSEQEPRNDCRAITLTRHQAVQRAYR